MMKVAKKDVLTLARACLMCLLTQKNNKFVLVDLKRYNKDLRELQQLRKLTEPRRR